MHLCGRRQIPQPRYGELVLNSKVGAVLAFAPEIVRYLSLEDTRASYTLAITGFLW